MLKEFPNGKLTLCNEMFYMLFKLNEKQIVVSQWQDIAVNLVFHWVLWTVYTKPLNAEKTKLKFICEAYITLVKFCYKKKGETFNT